MRSPAPALLALLLLAGCLDAEGFQITLSANVRKATVQVEERTVGMHRKGADECATTEACRAWLRDAACGASDGTDAVDAAGLTTAVEPQEDGSVDLVTTYRQPLDALTRLDDGDAFRGATILRPSGPRERPTAAWSFDGDIDVEALKGRFEGYRTGPADGDGHSLWVQRSNRGTLRLRALTDTPGSDAVVRWLPDVPGLAEALVAEPITCARGEAGPAEE